MYWLNPDCVLDRNIVGALWKYSSRLRRIYSKYDRENLDEAEIRRTQAMIGAFDEYIKSQVKKILRYLGKKTIWKTHPTLLGND